MVTKQRVVMKSSAPGIDLPSALCMCVCVCVCRGRCGGSGEIGGGGGGDGGVTLTSHVNNNVDDASVQMRLADFSSTKITEGTDFLSSLSLRL